MLRSTDSVKRVLLVNRIEETLLSWKKDLENNGIREVEIVSDPEQVELFLIAEPVPVVVLDLAISGAMELLSKLVQLRSAIIVTADNEIETAVQCIKLGAFDYLVKPVEGARLAASVQKALNLSLHPGGAPSLRDRQPVEDHDHLADFTALVTRNKKMRELFRYAEMVAGSGQPVLITGETGVGKELVAQAIHKLSGCKGEFVPLNAAGLDDLMFSDALFGHRKGAFTGADQARDGLVARAAGGTLFLDEIGDLNELSQIKLLRLLQEGEFYPGGSDVPRRSSAHMVLATNRDLHKRMAEGKFRDDLYYRLFSHQIKIPPLRERKDDLELLLDHFIACMSQQLGIVPPRYSGKLVDLLKSYEFPGNVRELQGMINDAVVCSKGGMLCEEPFLRALATEQATPAPQPPNHSDTRTLQQMLEAVWGHFPTLHEAEDLLIGTALQVSNGNQRIAAGMLGLQRQTLNMRLKVRRQNGETPAPDGVEEEVRSTAVELP